MPHMIPTIPTTQEVGADQGGPGAILLESRGCLRVGPVLGDLGRQEDPGVHLGGAMTHEVTIQRAAGAPNIHGAIALVPVLTLNLVVQSSPTLKRACRNTPKETVFQRMLLCSEYLLDI